MEEEFNALKKNNTWQLVPYNSDLRIVDYKWIFKTKFTTNGEVERYKDRLVAKSFQQDPGGKLWQHVQPNCENNNNMNCSSYWNNVKLEGETIRRK